VAEAVALLDDHTIDLVITDLKMSPLDGLQLVRHVRENCTDIEVVVMTAFPALETAISATKIGAERYLEKPFPPATLVDAVRESLEKIDLRRLAHSGSGDDLGGARGGFIGDSPAMQKVYAAIPKIALSDATVLIRGESGTGKELVARAIHQESRRSSGPFLSINCAALAEDLLESDLFGHVRGAFTGADRVRQGMFVRAHRGVLFLDEIGEMSPKLQAELLRVLEDGMVRPVGTMQDRAVDVRVVAATHRDLRDLTADGRFREDLYFRLNVLSIELPPLRERGTDIVLLAGHFLAKYAQDPERRPRLSDDVIERLLTYAWPGNVRELDNLMQFFAAMFEGEVIDVADLPEEMRFAVQAKPRLNRTIREVDDEHMQAVYFDQGRNLTKAAKILGIHRHTLREHLKDLGVIDGAD
jgi:two-component system response regulator HydG